MSAPMQAQIVGQRDFAAVPPDGSEPALLPVEPSVDSSWTSSRQAQHSEQKASDNEGKLAPQ